ncbi:MFS transporter [Rhizobium rhizogenes]|uniref:MFS transporter n=1 Tax=Rhizobium rhizogenes TaxID=359 RepID=UPI001574D589|nr:MFS transporter [Rhizobium rhizogenes]NTH43311.1 MFS transporter [Rhizobium rhizogenes]NTH56175.1 MFS transporter [Rhizobium rhizogenes]NTH91126.1 MFS transporter [Rhizobium rhizogenes]NTI24059.1 MFS transporter [Rhizobium rhizogenes]QTG07543.1 MFS transporter [Rhizobium rhizogenes]
MNDMMQSESLQARRSGFFTKPRAAVSLLFLMNGFSVGCWAPKIPEFAERLQLSKFELGLMILVFGIGSLVMMPIAGAQIAGRGSKIVVKAFAVLLVPMLLAMTLVESVWTAAIAIFLFGGFIGAMDVAMNANAVSVEKSMRRAIMSSCHAFWSLGGLLGAAIGGFLISHLGYLGHAEVVTVLSILILAVAWPMILGDQPHPDEAKPKARLPMVPLPWLLGLMALFSMMPEGAVLDWSALYLSQEKAASVTLSGFGFAAFSLTMAAMRFAGDFVRDQLGAVKTLRVCTVFAIVGMVIAALAPNAELAIVGFALCGIGISNMVPIAFSAAGNIPGLQPGIGISVVTTLGYSGMLVAPSAIGFAAEHVGFSPVLLALPVLLLVVLALSSLARYADGIGENSH